MDGKFAASRENGKWSFGSLYDAYEISEFRVVRDQVEAAVLFEEAHREVS
jgi:hypothetical protein